MSLFGITHLALLEMDLERNKESMLESDKKSRCFYKLGFIKHILEENLQRDKNLEKKREFSREREKSQMKKRFFFSGEIPLEKILFS